MVRDIHIRVVFIPLLGVVIPYASHIIKYENYSIPELAAIQLYCIFTSWCIWMGCNRAHVYLRKKLNIGKNVYYRVAAISLVSTLYSAVIGGGLTSIWLLLSNEEFTWSKIFLFVVYTALAVTVFTLLYEVLFLDHEKEKHMKIAGELEREIQHAETAILRNEIDPHFIFNSLSTLNHLIVSDPGKAAFYNENLAQVYKYVLQNKNKKAIQLNDELEFIKDYFSLLQIRFENKVHLNIHINAVAAGNSMIVPCALQIVIENAIKHNEFSDENPLSITVSINDHHLLVSNNILPKPLILDSTETGLKNLNGRYKLLSDKTITIHKNNKSFSVTLPLLSSIKPYNYA